MDALWVSREMMKDSLQKQVMHAHHPCNVWIFYLHLAYDYSLHFVDGLL